MIFYLLKLLWLFLPAAFANMAPVFFKRLNFLNYPVDFNKKLNKQPLFGANKTIRGFVFGILSAILIVYIQKLLFPYTQSISIINYSETNVFLLGFLLGFGALLGDLIKSFVKRRFSIKPGQQWIPFDQIDWVIGSLMLLSFYIPLHPLLILVSIFFLGVLHPLINYLGYIIKLKKNKF